MRLSFETLMRVGISLFVWSGAAWGTVRGSAASAQIVEPPRIKNGGSPNVKMLGHVPFDGRFSNGGVDIEQELSRPYVYVSGMTDDPGFWVVSVADPAKPKVIYHWHFPASAQDQGLAGENGRYFKLDGRYYYAKTVQFNKGSPHDSLGLIVFDVTGLPDPTKVKEVAHIGSIGARVVHVFPYKHSDGRVLLITTPTVGAYGQIYDARKLISQGAQQALLAQVDIPPDVNIKQITRGFHDTYAQYDPATKQDKLYGAGSGGFGVYDITKPETPRFLFMMAPQHDLVTTGSHTVIVSPDSRYAVATVEQQYWPMFVFDLQPGLSGQSKVVQPIAAWTADWRDLPHLMAVRWPYVFVAAYEDGLQIVSLNDPKQPKTLGWYYTCVCEHQMGWGGSPTVPGTSVLNGAGDVDVRNADGLIVVTDYTTGLWTFRMDGFDGWNGRQFRMPNISKEQDWDNGPAVALRQ
jgi:hypothetical protein